MAEAELEKNMSRTFKTFFRASDEMVRGGRRGTCVCMCVFAYMCMCMHVCEYLCVCASVLVCTHMCLCLCVCVIILVYDLLFREDI